MNQAIGYVSYEVCPVGTQCLDDVMLVLSLSTFTCTQGWQADAVHTNHLKVNAKFTGMQLLVRSAMFKCLCAELLTVIVTANVCLQVSGSFSLTTPTTPLADVQLRTTAKGHFISFVSKWHSLIVSSIKH